MAKDYVVPNVLSPRDLVLRPDNMDETVLQPHKTRKFHVFHNEIEYKLNAQKSCTTFSFWIKIDDFKNQNSLVFMPVQKTIVAEKIKCVGNHAYIFARKMENRNFWAYNFPRECFRINYNLHLSV